MTTRSFSVQLEQTSELLAVYFDYDARLEEPGQNLLLWR